MTMRESVPVEKFVHHSWDKWRSKEQSGGKLSPSSDESSKEQRGVEVK